MKPIELLELVVQEAESSRPVVLCTVVEATGSTPQVPGAMMVIDHKGSLSGTIGGGCVEADVRRRGFELLESRQAELMEISLENDVAGEEGLICGGRMKIAVTPVSERTQIGLIRHVLRELNQGRDAKLRINLEVENRELHYLVPIDPEPKLVIAGAGHIGQELARLALNIGFKVTVVDTRSDFLSRERFPEPIETFAGEFHTVLGTLPIDHCSYVVIVTRGHRFDQTAMVAVAEKPARYIGMIGSRRKVGAIMQNLESEGMSSDALSRVYSPIGVSINSVTVPEIAVSIAAELISVRRSAGKGFVEGPFFD